MQSTTWQGVQGLVSEGDLSPSDPKNLGLTLTLWQAL